MLFIALLAAVTTAIAGAAAYFSVYGLAYTFSGVFWSVVVMGASLEFGKLIAASFLYRYWNRLGGLLKGYLCFGVVALMILTSTGIFGYLSTGYQQDILPLKQKTEQVQLLEADKTRALARKQQIDDLLAGNTTSTNIVSSEKTAARNLAAAAKNREALAKQYNAEQSQVTKHVADLDEQLLALKQDLIKTEAHIGPITYVAKAFNLPTDDATKYLIFLIIFTFDPMAVALTLCVNMAIRWKQEDDKSKDKPKQSSVASDLEYFQNKHPVSARVPEEYMYDSSLDTIADDEVDLASTIEYMDEDEPPDLELVPIEDEPQKYPVASTDVADLDFELIPEEKPQVSADFKTDHLPRVQSEPLYTPRARINPENAKIAELITHLRMLKSKQANGIALNADEEWEHKAIEAVLQRSGYSKYL